MTIDHERPTGWTDAKPAITAADLARQPPPLEPFGNGGVRFAESHCARAWVQPEDGGWRPYVEARTPSVEINVPGDDLYVWRCERVFVSMQSATMWLTYNVAFNLDDERE